MCENRDVDRFLKLNSKRDQKNEISVNYTYMYYSDISVFGIFVFYIYLKIHDL